MGRVRLFLLGIAVSTIAVAQGDTLWAPKRMLTINPIALIDPFGPSSLRVGTEMLVSPHITFALEASGFYQYIPVMAAPQEHFQGAGARLSTYFWLRRSPRYAKALSLDLGYKFTTGLAVDSIKLDGVAPYRLDYGLEREVFTVRLCMVEQRYWWKRLWSELYYGVGVRFKNATSSGITEEELDARDFSYGTDNDNYIVPAMHGVGEFVQPDFVIGLRIGLAHR